MRAAIEEVIFRHRKLVLLVFAAVTLFLGYQGSRLRIDAGFEKLLPSKHPYTQTFMQHQQEFAGSNRLLIAIRSKSGDIFSPEFFNVIKEVTDEVFFLPGVNRSTVQSIYTPNVRFIEIVEGGFTGGNVIPADFRPTPQGLSQVRENILKAGIVGRLVSDDFSAVMVSAQLVEVNPATGDRLDYLHVAELLETNVREPFVSEDVDIHIIGFAKVMGDIADGALGVILFFGITFLVTALLVYGFCRSLKLTLLPLFCSLIAVVWDLGLMTSLGLGLDPMSLLVPFLVFAIAVSHGVQMINAVRGEIQSGTDPLTASRKAFRGLVVPGGVALVSDTIGFLTLLLIQIPMIQDLAMTAGVGVAVVLLTNLVLLPILLSYMGVARREGDHLSKPAESMAGVWRAVASLATRKRALACIAVAIGFGAYGLIERQNLKIGDLQEGVPELHSNSRYNHDSRVITEKFSVGLDVLTVIIETVPDGCVEYDVMDRIDQFAWQMRNVPGVQSTLSLPQVAKLIHAGWNEGHLKWRALPRNRQVLSQAISPVETSTGLLNADCSVMPVMIFLEDHRAETIERVTEEVSAFAAENNSERFTLRLGMGNAGVMAATNDVVRDSQVRILLYIYAAVALLCLMTFRSWRAALCIILPLGLVSILCYALMSLLSIGLKTTTLPVVALGVGIGVDYSIYVFSRMRGAMRDAPLHEAYIDTLRTTGKAVLVTGMTLAAAVLTWVFSALKFQADMGLLLAFMFLANMLGAVLLLPSLAAILIPPTRTGGEVQDEG